MNQLPSRVQCKGDKIVFCPDIHGDIVMLRTLLHAAGLIDQTGFWIGSNNMLIQTGDIFDRGPFALECAFYLRNLQNMVGPEQVVVTLGNHEVMQYFDNQYVHEFENVACQGADRRLELFSPSHYLGDWLKRLPVVVRESNSKIVASMDASQIFTRRPSWTQSIFMPTNDFVWPAPTLGWPMHTRAPLLHHETSILWSRTWFENDGIVVQDLAKRWDASAFVVGHTIAPSMTPIIHEAGGIKVVQNDCGNSSWIHDGHYKPRQTIHWTEYDMKTKEWSVKETPLVVPTNYGTSMPRCMKEWWYKPHILEYRRSMKDIHIMVLSTVQASELEKELNSQKIGMTVHASALQRCGLSHAQRHKG